MAIARDRLAGTASYPVLLGFGLLLGSALGAAPAKDAMPEGLREAGRALAEGQLERASRLLGPVLERAPEHALVQFTAGSLAFKQRRREDALRHFKRAATLDPKSPARDILSRLAPRLAGDCRLLEGPELAEAFAYSVDFRRQQEVEVALARFLTSKGLHLEMRAADWPTFETFLVDYGYLARPGGPPTRQGAYEADASGDLRSTVYGSWRKKDRAPEALRSAGGFCALASDIAEQIRARAPGALEVGLPMLAPTELARYSRQVGGAVFEAKDPWNVDAVLASLERASEARTTLPPGLRPWLDRIARRQVGAPRWRALALQRRFGVERVVSVPAKELPAVLVAIRDGVVPREAGLAALESQGDKGGVHLTDLLLHGDLGTLPTALELAAEFPVPEVLEVLVAALEAPGARWGGLQWMVRGALQQVAGRPVGPTPAAWRAWLEQRGR